VSPPPVSSGTAERREIFYTDLLSSVEAAKEIRLFGTGAFLRGRMLAERRAANTAKRAVDRREVVAQFVFGSLTALVSGAGLLWAIRAARAGHLTAGDITIFVAAVAGVQTSLVGVNGAGKSTLVKLICRFYDPVRGAILWDGTNVRDFDITDLRERIGAVFQDYMHYDLTARENIGLGALTALSEPARIEEAAVRAGVHEGIRALPNGYEMLLSRMFFTESEKDDPVTGVSLSGGQWRRLALARSLLRADADLIVLDEPSAGLDARAEHEMHASLRDLRRGRTSLLISHRMGAVRDADLIVVLSDGRVAEQGRHDDLLRAGGVYAELFTLRAAGYDMSPARP
jgi:ABC-type multidrug transport system fused ATPase/permease subunit